MKKNPAQKIIKVGPDVCISLLLGQDREWLGIGGISVAGVALRDAKHPLVVRLETPEGIQYTSFLLKAVRAKGRGVEVELKAVGQSSGRQEYQDEYNQVMVVPGVSREPIEDLLTLWMMPAKETIGGRDWHGFEWNWSFRSAKRGIHRLLVDGSWEIGGSITGDTVLHQGQCNRPVYRGARKTVFTTTCLKTLDQYGSPQGVSYQLAPRGGLLQAFDFQYGAEGALLHYWPRYDAVSSLLESPKGYDRLYVIDEYRFPLSRRVTTLTQKVLFAPGRLAFHESRNLWWAAHEHVNGNIRRQFGVTNTSVRPETGLKYSTRVVGQGVKMTVAGVEVDSREVPYAIADHVMPLLAKAGIRRFFPEVMSESDVTVVGLRRKLDGGVHGDLHCSSVCGTHRFQPAEFWGGMKAWRYMADKARGLGIEIGAWFAPHFSPRAAIYEEHPDWRMIDSNSMISGGGYGPQCIVSADWNTGIFDWVLADIKRWQEEGGLDYLFTDSFANLGLVQQNYSRRMRTSWRRLGALYGEFQKLGIKAYTFEGISPFGASRFGVADLRGDLLEAAGGIVGQNDFGWWTDDLDMAYGICFHAAFRKRPTEEVRGLQFRAMANRAYLMPDPLCGQMYNLPEWAVTLNRIYEQALPHMRNRTILPGRQGVLWSGAGAQVLWAFADVSIPSVAGARIEQLLGDRVTPIASSGALAAKAECVYRIL